MESLLTDEPVEEKRPLGDCALTREEVLAALARGAVHARESNARLKECFTPTTATMALILGALLLVLGNLLTPLVTKAQDPLPLPAVELPPVGETLALDANARAPWAGMLVRDEDLFALQSSLMTTRLALDNTHRLYLDALAGRASLLETAERSCLDRVALHDSLWRERRDELALALEKERSRGISWYEVVGYGFVGFAIGALVALPIGFVLGFN